jgi:outer membrane biosynthesis protein TonB
MSDFDDLDELFGPLRSDPTPAELASEHDVVALMAANHASSKGTTMFTSRRARVATLIAAGIIGFGGVAAAGPVAFDLLEDEPVEEEVETEQEVETEEVEVEEVETEEVEEPAEEPAVEQEVEEQEVVDEPAPSPAAVEESTVTEEETTAEPVDLDDKTTTFDESLCVGEGNHGYWVSMAARGELDIAPFTQRDIAQSSCGKTDGTETDGEVVEEPEIEEEPEEIEEPEIEEEPEEVEPPAAPSRGKSDQAPGRNNANNGKKGD